MGEENPKILEASNGRIEEEEEEEEELFYETIEAPKYVDLTAPDHFRPGDDSYWFCARVGCDQKHEEELDPEAIYKNFVLRVMAARSPNVRLRKAFYKKDSSVKCPQTVPVKPSKPRVQRLALISSISKKIADPKIKVKPPPSKQTTTPSSKLKPSSVVTKALTTPRTKKQLPNEDVFRSVRNPKTTAKAATSNRVVAKALVFHSPKRAAKTKPSLELKTPVKELCSAMKKLDIASGKKHVLGYNRSPLSETKRKQFRGREVRSRFCDGLSSQSRKGEEAKMKSLKCLKSKNKEMNLQKVTGPAPLEKDEIDPSAERIVQQLKTDMVELSSNAKGSQGSTNEGALENDKVSTSLSGDDEVEAPSISSSGGGLSILNPQEQSITSLSGDDEVEAPSISSSGGGLSILNPQEQSIRDADIPEGHDEEDRNGGLSSDKCSNNITENEDNELSLTSNDKENEGEAPENDDKENASASYASRELEVNRNNIGDNKSLGRHEIQKNAQKIERGTTKKTSTTAAMVPPELKQRKPKPTNPKPFRLRTDERGILKEANLDKKHAAVSLKEITFATSLGAHAEEEHQRILRLNKTANSMILEEKMGRKLATTTTSKQKLVSPKQDKEVHQYGNNLKRGESHAKKWLGGKPRHASMRTKEMVSVVTPGQLGVINEATPTISRPHEQHAKPSKSGASPQNKDSISTGSKQMMRSKSFRVNPREPKFHAMHMPKSCTRRVVA